MAQSKRQARTRASEWRRVQTTNQITGNRRWWALAAVLISMFFSSLSQTVVSTAMPTIISDLEGFNLYTWTFTAYILAAAVTVPIYGRLSDTFGRKPFYIFGLTVFVVGSALCGMANSMTWLIFARGLQGIGGGAMMSMPRATVGDIFNPRERGKWMGVIMSVFGISSLIGPTLGGWITDALSWRWVFYVNLPVALAALGMILYALPTVRTGESTKIDWSGAALLAGGLVALLLGFTWGGTKYAWTSPQEIGLFAAAAALLVLFALNERRAVNPVIALHMFTNRTFNSTMVISMLIMMTMFSAMMFLPIFVQGVLGISATEAGFIMTPMMLSFMVGSIIAGQLLTRTGRYKVQSVTSGVFLVVGTWLLTRLDVTSTWPSVVAGMIVMGLGIGSLMPVMGTVIQNLFPYKMMGTVNATQQSVQTLSGAIAAPIFGAILAGRFAERFAAILPPQLERLVASLPPEQQSELTNPQGLVSAGAQEAIQQQFTTFGPAGDELYRQFISAVREALAFATTELYVVAFAFAILAFLTTFLLKEVRLKTGEFYESDADRAAPDRASASDPAPPRRS